VTRYSLSNDGNYVEVLALGTWALVFALRWADEPARRSRWALAIGLLLGLAFWCHILAVIPAAAVAVFLLLQSPRDAALAAPPGVLGFALGDLPGLLWNAANGWESFAYLLRGRAHRRRPPRAPRRARRGASCRISSRCCSATTSDIRRPSTSR
jgi:4-amino-4-deoxy-L-arabinose transferase-like glycosyltransferase